MFYINSKDTRTTSMTSLTWGTWECSCSFDFLVLCSLCYVIAIFDLPIAKLKSQNYQWCIIFTKVDKLQLCLTQNMLLKRRSHQYDKFIITHFYIISSLMAQVWTLIFCRTENDLSNFSVIISENKKAKFRF